MAGADGIAPHLLKNLQPPLPDPLRNRGAHAAPVVMEANSVELHAFAVQQESIIGIENGLANADRRIVFIRGPASGPHRAVDFVQVRIVNGPKARKLHLYVCRNSYS